jgi:hypothetical protein
LKAKGSIREACFTVRKTKAGRNDNNVVADLKLEHWGNKKKSVSPIIGSKLQGTTFRKKKHSGPCRFGNTEILHTFQKL